MYFLLSCHSLDIDTWSLEILWQISYNHILSLQEQWKVLFFDMVFGESNLAQVAYFDWFWKWLNRVGGELSSMFHIKKQRRNKLYFWYVTSDDRWKGKCLAQKAQLSDQTLTLPAAAFSRKNLKSQTLDAHAYSWQQWRRSRLWKLFGFWVGCWKFRQELHGPLCDHLTTTKITSSFPWLQTRCIPFQIGLIGFELCNKNYCLRHVIW